MRPVPTLLLALATAAGALGPALAQGGPYRVDDSEIAPPGTVKLEGYGSFSVNRARERGYTLTPGGTFEALPFVEFSVELARDGEARGDEADKLRVWSSGVSPQLKVSILPLERHGVGLALKAGVSYLTAAQQPAADPETPRRFRRLDLPFATAIVSVAPIEGVTVSANLGVEHDRTETRTAPTWGLGAAWEAIETVSLIGAVSGTDRGRAALQGGEEDRARRQARSRPRARPQPLGRARELDHRGLRRAVLTSGGADARAETMSAAAAARCAHAVRRVRLGLAIALIDLLAALIARRLIGAEGARRGVRLATRLAGLPRRRGPCGCAGRRGGG